MKTLRRFKSCLLRQTNEAGSTDQASGLQGTPGRAGWGPGGIFTAAAGARGPRKGQN